MSIDWVDAFIDALIRTSVGILTESTRQCLSFLEVEQVVRERKQIRHFGWMPAAWIVSQTHVDSSHEVLKVTERPEIPLHDIVGFLEPFLYLATRSMDAFRLVNDALMCLYDLKPQETRNDFPISFRFLMNEFGRYVLLARENAEMSKVLTELCESMKKLPTQRRKKERRHCKKVNYGSRLRAGDGTKVDEHILKGRPPGRSSPNKDSRSL